MLDRLPLGRTGHVSTRLVFGSYALSEATQTEADQVLELLLAYGVNHIDTAPMYGKAEQRIGRWMEKHRDHFFIATKTRSRPRDAAWKNLQRSLERLRVDTIDLWQMHGLTNPAGWERAVGPGGALEALLEARDRGLVRFLGVTGHGIRTAAMHLQSLARFDFDSVMLPFNYALMQNPRYAKDWDALTALCRERNVAIQTMKTIARVPCRGRSESYHTYFYEPLETQGAIDAAVHWALGEPDIFVATVGDMQLLPKFLDAATRSSARPSEADMAAHVAEYGIQAVFK
jgi:aryl-alcohol dehydrogenase-like predicted oxidoreductase